MLEAAPSRLAIVGRVGDRASVAGLFNDGARLVTIIGPGGMGKTRLATCYADEQRESYGAPGDGGVWFVDAPSCGERLAAPGVAHERCVGYRLATASVVGLR